MSLSVAVSLSLSRSLAYPEELQIVMSHLRAEAPEVKPEVRLGPEIGLRRRHAHPNCLEVEVESAIMTVKEDTSKLVWNPLSRQHTGRNAIVDSQSRRWNRG